MSSSLSSSSYLESSSRSLNKGFKGTLESVLPNNISILEAYYEETYASSITEINKELSTQIEKKTKE